MKKIIFLTVFFFMCLNLMSQEKNHLSVDPFLPFFGTYQIHYERGIKPKISFEIGIGIKTSSGIFELPNINSEKIQTEDFNFKGFKIIPEFRWYLTQNDKGLFGFYTGVYYKYQNYTMPLQGTYIDNENVKYDFSFDAKIITNSMGLEIGYKLKIRKHFFTDFIIAGRGISFNRLELKEKSLISQGFYNDLADAISQYPALKNLDLNINFSDNQKNRSTQINLPAFRYGIKIGYCF